MRILPSVVFLVLVDGRYGNPGRALVEFIAIGGLVETVQAEEAGVFGKRASRICGNELGEVGLRSDEVLVFVVAQTPIILDRVIFAGAFGKH